MKWLGLFFCGAMMVGCGKPVDPMEVLRQNQDAMFALKGFRATCVTEIKSDTPSAPVRYQISTLVAEKPNKMRYDCWRTQTISSDPLKAVKDKTPNITFACDGKKEFSQFGDHYRSQPFITPDQLTTILEPWAGFYSVNASVYGMTQYQKKEGDSVKTAYQGSEKVEGIDCDKVYVETASTYEGDKMVSQTTLYIGKKDHFIRRAVEHIQFEGKAGFTRTATIRDMVLNETAPSKTYTYVPPKGVSSESEMAAQAPPLLAKGAVAPKFTAEDVDRKPVRLTDFRGKVVVLDFWASWCGPCKMSMPVTEAAIKKLSGEGIGVVALAVDDGEDFGDFQSWVKSQSSQYPSLHYAHVSPEIGLSGKQYHVTGIPTQYVIDKKGVIRASFVGFNPDSSELENAIRDAAR